MPVDGDHSPATQRTALEPGEVRHAIAHSGVEIPLQRLALVIGRRDDQLAAAPVPDAAVFAITIEPLAAPHAQHGLQAAGRVVKAGVDDFGIAAARVRPVHGLPLEDQSLDARHREAPRHREPDDAATDDDAIHVLHTSMMHVPGPQEHCFDSARRVASAATAPRLEGPTNHREKPMSISSPIFAPAIVLVLWSLVMLGWLAITRLPAMAKAGVDLTNVVGARGANLEGVVPDKVNWKSHNYTHLMEQPTLFYVTVVILGVIGQGDGLNLSLAWAYVILRILHSIVQATWNRVAVRFTLFCLATAALLMLAVHAAIALL